MGTVACLAQFVEARGPALKPAIASVSTLLDQAAANTSKAASIDEEWVHAVATASAEHLERPGGADGPNADALLLVAARAFNLLRCAHNNKSAANPDALQYSLIRKLVGQGAHAAALAQGWELHAALTSTTSTSKQQAPSQQLLTGATINLVVCTSEAGVPQPQACGKLGEAVALLAAQLRSHGGAAAAQQHADVMVRYILKVRSGGGG